MLKIDAKALGIEKPIIIKKVTMGIMRKIVAIDLDIAKISDNKGKPGIQTVSDFVNNLAKAEQNTFDLLGLTQKQRDYIDNNIEPMTFLDWFSNNLATPVFTAMMPTTDAKATK